MAEAIVAAKKDERVTVGIKTAAKIFDVPETRLRMMCLTGKIEGAKRVGKYWFMPFDVLNSIFNGKKEGDADGRR